MDLSVDGPGSPVSLKKFLEEKGEELNSLTVLVDGTGSGIAVDGAPVLTITPADCAMQAEYFRDTFFVEDKVPEYIFRDFETFYHRNMEGMSEADRRKMVSNLIKYLEPEAKQILGLIILIRGTLSAAKRKGAGIRIYIEHPETHMHPSRQSAFASFMAPLIS